MTRAVDDELDRLVEENRCSATLDADARRQLRDALEPVAVPGGTRPHPRGRPGRLPLPRRRGPAAGRRPPTTTATRSSSPRSGAATSSARWRSSPTGPRTATVHASCATRTCCASRPTAFTQLVVGPPGVGPPDQHRDGGPPAALPGASAARARRWSASPCCRSAPSRRSREFGEHFERALARLTGSARQIDSAAAAAAVGDELEGRRLAPVVQRPRDRERSRRVPRRPGADAVDPRVRPPGRPAAARRRRDHVAGSPPPRAGRAAAPGGRAQPDRARARAPGVDRGPARARRDGSRPARSTGTTTCAPTGSDDADRVARLVLSRGIGVVYSGGGARGIAELGVLRALREANVPIDAAGGTSIGSIIAGATAQRDGPRRGRSSMLREALVDGKSPVDLTLPRGLASRPARACRSGCRTPRAASTSRTRGSTGSASRPTSPAARSRCTGPGPGGSGCGPASRSRACSRRCAPPTATCSSTAACSTTCPSASCAGCTTASRVIAVDVGSKRDVRAGELPDSGVVSGWKWLMQRVDPRATTPEMAGIIRVLMRITELGGTGGADLGDLYIRPPVDGDRDARLRRVRPARRARVRGREHRDRGVAQLRATPASSLLKRSTAGRGAPAASRYADAWDDRRRSGTRSRR